MSPPAESRLYWWMFSANLGIMWNISIVEWCGSLILVEYCHRWILWFIDLIQFDLPWKNQAKWLQQEQYISQSSSIFHRVLETRKWKIKLSKGVFYSETSPIGSCQLTVYSVFCLVHTGGGMKSKLSGVVRSFSQQRHSLLFPDVALLFCFGFSFLACFVRQSEM